MRDEDLSLSGKIEHDMDYNKSESKFLTVLLCNFTHSFKLNLILLKPIHLIIIPVIYQADLPWPRGFSNFMAML